MKTVRLAAAVMTMALWLGALPSRAADEADSAIRARERQMAAAINARDMEGLTALLAPEFVFHFFNQPPIEGKENFRKFMTAALTPGRTVKIRTLSVVANGDLAVSIGEMNIITPKKDGTPDERPGKLLNVWKRGPDGVWRLAVHAPSPNAECAP